MSSIFFFFKWSIIHMILRKALLQWHHVCDAPKVERRWWPRLKCFAKKDPCEMLPFVVNAPMCWNLCGPTISYRNRARDFNSRDGGQICQRAPPDSPGTNGTAVHLNPLNPAQLSRSLRARRGLRQGPDRTDKSASTARMKMSASG